MGAEKKAYEEFAGELNYPKMSLWGNAGLGGGGGGAGWRPFASLLQDKPSSRLEAPIP